MDTIDLREKNFITNLKYMLILVSVAVITCFLPNVPTFMKIVITIMTLFCLGALIWATFFIKNELIFYENKLVYNRYKERVEVNYDEIKSIKYNCILSAETNVVVPVHVKRHYIIVTYKNNKELTMELYGNVFIEEQINTLFKKYNQV